MTDISLRRRFRHVLSDVYRPVENRFPTGWVLLSPASALLGLVVALPLGTALLLSLTEYNLTYSTVPTVVGLQNYVVDVAGNPLFVNALLNTVVFVVAAVLLEFLLGFGLALLLWRRFPGRGVFRAVMLTPMFVAPVAVGLMFRFMFNTQMGVVPHLLGTVGLGGVSWFTDPTLAMGVIVLADVWQWTPYMIVLLLAGLEALPADPYEAARIDGATSREQFLEITLPLMRPVIGAALLIRIIDASKVFAKVYTMTNGGPGISTETLAWYIYKTGFQHYHLGVAASQSVTVLLMIVGLGYVQTYVVGRGEDYA